MAQITQGVRSILSHPAIYSAFQNLMGAYQLRSMLVKDFIRPYTGMRLLDIGCGPADILAHLPDIDYCGFDISPLYVEQAKARFGQRGQFHCQILTEADLENMPPFDFVLAFGLLHHLDDGDARNVMQLARQALKSGGRLLTIDPCLTPGQNPIARFLVSHDRGQNVRDKTAYSALARSVFNVPLVDVRHRQWIPYTHCIMECIR
jgi:SAM-dependent methyltransferase